MVRLTFAALVVAGLALGTAQAGEFNKKVKIGDAAPVFSKLPGVDGKDHALADLKDKEVVVLVITCNHCPVAVAYEDRIIAFTKKHAGPDSKVGVVAINVNNGEVDRLPKMIERSKEKGFNFPYLFDESQETARALGASVTPEFFVLNKDRKIVYMGAMDDKMVDPTKSYLEPAVAAALKGEEPDPKETAPRGCGVKYEKKKKKTDK
jgi:peroxiredoxin